jgi:MbtH protein
LTANSDVLTSIDPLRPSAWRGEAVRISAEGGVAMHTDETEDTTIYNVVLNHEEQYSIWPVDREPPLGWRVEGKSGTKSECLAYIGEVWKDIRPLSLRQRLEAAHANR